MRILKQPPQLDGVPEPLRGIVAATLVKDPQQRPTARQLLAALVAGEAPPTVTPRRGGRRRLVVTAAGIAVAVVAATIFGLALRLQGDPEAAGPQPSAVTSASASAAAAPSQDPYAALPGANRRTLIHVAEIDRDLSLDRHWYEVTASDGTGPNSLFVLEPAGVDYLIRSLRSDGHPQDAKTCVGVRLVPGDGAWLQAADCRRSAATLFSLTPTGGTDDKGRPRFSIHNAEYGYALWDAKQRKIAVDEIGDVKPQTTFSFVDRGPL
jgi:eukaryotic-like serine/threonine-protein kinase